MDPKKKQVLDQYHYERDLVRNDSGNMGVIQSYDPESNTATVLMSSSDSDLMGDIITDVMCPVMMGIQTVAPEPGRPCWVVFKPGLNDKRAVISHYFNHNYRSYDYAKYTTSRSSVPRYILGM